MTPEVVETTCPACGGRAVVFSIDATKAACVNPFSQLGRCLVPFTVKPPASGSSPPVREDSNLSGTDGAPAKSGDAAGSYAPHGKTPRESDSGGTRTGGERPSGRCPACLESWSLEPCGSGLALVGHYVNGRACVGSGCLPLGPLPPRSLAEEALLSDGDHLDPRRGAAILPASCGSPSIVACDGACDDCAHEPSTLPAAKVCRACEREPAAEGADLCDGCHLVSRVMRGDSLAPGAVQLHATVTGVRRAQPDGRRGKLWEVQVSLGLGAVGRDSASDLAEAVALAASRAVRAWLGSRPGRKAVRS